MKHSSLIGFSTLFSLTSPCAYAHTSFAGAGGFAAQLEHAYLHFVYQISSVEVGLFMLACAVLLAGRAYYKANAHPPPKALAT